MTTARALLTRSLQMIGVLGEGEVPTAATAADVLALWNGFIEQISIGGATAVYEEKREDFPLTANVAAYTIGTGGDFNTARPVRIRQAYLRQLGSTQDYDVELIGDDRYAHIGDKSRPGIPGKAYYDGNYPLANIIFDALPPSGMTLFIISEKPLTRIPSINTELSFPPGYEIMFQFNLAVLAAPFFEKEASQTIRGNAHIFLQTIENDNAQNDDTRMRCDDALAAISGNCGENGFYQ